MPLWPEEFPLESASFRLTEKPVEFTDEVSSEENSPSSPNFRFASSDFTQDRNRILWQNVLTQELAHRFGSFLTKAAGNPFGMIGRALAHSGRYPGLARGIWSSTCPWLQATDRWPSEARSLDWGVFFDADFSPLDGNDWVDNGDGTFTLKRSYIDEAAFKRSTTGMPYNDLDLYPMGRELKCKGHYSF